MTLRGFEAVAASGGTDNNLGLSTQGGSAESGAVADDRTPTPADPDLARVVAAWATLSAPVRRAVLALVDVGASG